MVAAVAVLGLVPEAWPLEGKRAFDLQGHRGARGLAPENTLVAFARALGLGVTTLELDLAVTKDGVVVVSHDPLRNPDLTRGPDGRFIEGHGPPFRSLTFDEVRALDVGRLRPGSAYAAQFPDQVPADGARIPTLVEVYALAKRAGNRVVRFNVETKIDPEKPGETLAPEPFVDAVLKVVRDAGAISRTTLQSFDWRTLQYARRVEPELETVYLTEPRGGEEHPGASVPARVKAAGGRIWSPHFRDVTPEAVAEAHGLGLRVIPWTVNRPEDMDTMIDRGVDGLITDRPDLGRESLARKGLALPPPTLVVD
jgi:glycerophosphoryl diester phosphodiesterase